MSVSFSVVIPTIGRPCLDDCLHALATADGPQPEKIIVVDDRKVISEPLVTMPPDRWRDTLLFVLSGGRGPAAARNAGWRNTDSDWVVFVDDDVEVGPHWFTELVNDLSDAGDSTAAVSADIAVPLPSDRRPTDWERTVAGLADANWITADLAYRRDVLTKVGGFDERFRRAYREDADLALRVLDAGFELADGHRHSKHPVRRAPWWSSVRSQSGNADDPLMRRLHGRDWHRRAGAPTGRRPVHLGITAAGLAAVGSAVAGRYRLAGLFAAAWAAGTAEFATHRISAGPGIPAEVAAMVATSAMIPPFASAHWFRGVVRAALISPSKDG